MGAGASQNYFLRTDSVEQPISSYEGRSPDKFSNRKEGIKGEREEGKKKKEKNIRRPTPGLSWIIHPQIYWYIRKKSYLLSHVNLVLVLTTLII